MVSNMMLLISRWRLSVVVLPSGWVNLSCRAPPWLTNPCASKYVRTSLRFTMSASPIPEIINTIANFVKQTMLRSSLMPAAGDRVWVLAPAAGEGWRAMPTVAALCWSTTASLRVPCFHDTESIQRIDGVHPAKRSAVSDRTAASRRRAVYAPHRGFRRESSAPHPRIQRVSSASPPPSRKKAVQPGRKTGRTALGTAGRAAEKGEPQNNEACVNAVQNVARWMGVNPYRLMASI